MKKRVLALIFSVGVLSTVLMGCSSATTEKAYDTNADNLKSMFVEVEQTGSWRIVYDKETKVMYVVSFGAYNSGNFTLLVDKNGNPKLWDGE